MPDPATANVRSTGQDAGGIVSRTAGVSFEVLGRLRVRVNGAEVALPPGQLRWLLAVLLLHEGEVVPDGCLLEHAWAPGSASRAALRTAVSRLRQWLRVVDSTLAHDGRGYRLQTPESSIDASRFRQAMTAGGEIGEAGLFGHLQAWLSTCRDRPLHDAPEWVQDHPAVAALMRLRRKCFLDFGELARSTGRPETAVTQLAQLCAEYPHDEPVHSEYLRLLAASGRPAQALLHYDGLRARLRADLGSTPSKDVQAAHHAVLSMDQAGTSPAHVAVPVPAQLPPGTSRFAGRREQLQQLGATLSNAESSVAVCAVFGTAGVGKTTLAVHWAHGVRSGFPDGQLYVNLRGFDPGGVPLHPAEAVRGFLDALTGGGRQLPAAFAAQVGLYRSIVAERRILVLLDNAFNAEQVRPLLPGGLGCLAIVTSRHQLTGLVAADGAQPIALDLLPHADARELLQRRLGPERIAAEPAAADEIIARCARLPVALAVVAARAATNPLLPLAALAEDLAAGLDGLHDGDPSNNTRAIFSWSYRALSAPAARLFRLLTIHPGPSIGIAAAANMAGLTSAEVRPLLAELVHASLFAEFRHRYTVHDLLRLYGIELAHTLDGEDTVRGALRRVLRHYLHAAHSANEMLYRPAHPVPLPAADSDGETAPFSDRAGALAWLTAERHVLLGAARAAASAGLDGYAWRLAHAVFIYLEAHARWHDLATACEIAAQAAFRDEPPGPALTIRLRLAVAYGHLGRDREADAEVHSVLEMAEQAADTKIQADTHLHLAIMCEKNGDCTGALEHALLSLQLCRASGHTVSEGKALNNIGWFYTMLGDPEKGVTYCREAIAVQHRIGAGSEADSWDSLAFSYSQLGRQEEALAAFQRAIELYQNIGNQFGLAATLMRLADVQETVDTDLAKETRRRARAILGELGMPVIPSSSDHL